MEILFLADDRHFSYLVKNRKSIDKVVKGDKDFKLCQQPYKSTKSTHQIHLGLVERRSKLVPSVRPFPKQKAHLYEFVCIFPFGLSVMLNGSSHYLKFGSSPHHETKMNGSVCSVGTTAPPASQCNERKSSQAKIHNDSLDQLGELLFYLSGFYLLLSIYEWLDLVYHTVIRDLT